MDVKGNTIKRKSVGKPLCKYGLTCYQKNPEHRKKFKHSTENETKSTDSDVDFLNGAPSKEHIKKSPRTVKKLKTPQLSVAESTHFDEPNKQTSTSENDESDSMHSFEETVGEILKSMPKDFFDFWKFCVSVNQSKPEDAFSEYGFYLVGVFDLLAKKLPEDMKIDISCHWRYYFDPPEFQTVIKKDGHDWYHIGYFRDDPLKKPSILASNSAAKNSKLILMGDNIFCAMNAELRKVIRSLNSKDVKNKATKLQQDLKKLAAAKKYDLNIKTDKTENRQKKVVAKTFHDLGIIVPVKNNVGYRCLPDSDNMLKNVLKKIVSTKDKSKQLIEQEALDRIISNVHFANDELDYGMGLEIGINLFCDGNPYFHPHILGILPLAYDLLNRSKYAAIIKAHLKNRRKGEKLSTLNVR